MMNCKDFKTWLGDKGLYDEKMSLLAKQHMASCAHCKKLNEADTFMEYKIRDGLHDVDPSPELLRRIEMDIQSVEKNKQSKLTFSSFVWKRMTPAVALAAVMFVLFLNPFSGQIKNIDQIRSFVIAEHNNISLTMSFKMGEVQDIPKWFAQRVGFKITMPELKNLGLKLIGGRECNLGKKKAAYLFYEKSGRKVSLFIINPSDLKFSMEAERHYRVSDRLHDVEIWKAKQMVYAIVERTTQDI